VYFVRNAKSVVNDRFKQVRGKCFVYSPFLAFSHVCHAITGASAQTATKPPQFLGCPRTTREQPLETRDCIPPAPGIVAGFKCFRIATGCNATHSPAARPRCGRVRSSGLQTDASCFRPDDIRARFQRIERCRVRQLQDLCHVAASIAAWCRLPSVSESG